MQTERFPKGYKFPKGKANSLLSAYLTGGINSYLGQVQPDQAAVDNTGSVYQNDMDMANVDEDMTGQTPVRQITQAPAVNVNMGQPTYKSPGFFRNLVSGGSAGQNYNRMLQLNQQAQNQATLAGVTNQYNINEILARGGQDRLTSDQKLDKEFEYKKQTDAQATQDDLIKAKAAEAYKRGVLPEHYGSVDEQTLRELEGKRLEQNASNAAMADPGYVDAVKKSVFAKRLADSLTNDKMIADTSKINMDTQMAPWVNVPEGTAAANRLTQQTIFNKPSLEFKPESPGGPTFSGGPKSIDGGINGEISRTAQQLQNPTMTGSMVQPQNPVVSPQPSFMDKMVNYFAPKKSSLSLSQLIAPGVDLSQPTAQPAAPAANNWQQGNQGVIDRTTSELQNLWSDESYPAKRRKNELRYLLNKAMERAQP